MSWPLAVSSIAWKPEQEAAMLPLLRAEGVSGIEVAPTKLWPDWQGMSPASAAEHRRRYADLGFATPAMQAILFGIKGVAVFQGPEAQQVFLDHLARVCDAAGEMGVQALVYGAPATRDPGALAEDAAWAIALDFFARAGAIAAARGTALCFEANPAGYNCRFGTTAAFAARLVAAVGHPGFRQHLDAAQIGMMAEDPAEAVAVAAPGTIHYHASEPNLGPFDAPVSPHAALAAALGQAGYGGWISLEMRETADPLTDVPAAARAVKTLYPIRETA